MFPNTRTRIGPSKEHLLLVGFCFRSFALFFFSSGFMDERHGGRHAAVSTSGRPHRFGVVPSSRCPVVPSSRRPAVSSHCAFAISKSAQTIDVAAAKLFIDAFCRNSWRRHPCRFTSATAVRRHSAKSNHASGQPRIHMKIHAGCRFGSFNNGRSSSLKSNNAL